MADLTIGQVSVQYVQEQTPPDELTSNAEDGCPAPGTALQMHIQIENLGSVATGSFLVQVGEAQQTVTSGLAAGDHLSLVFPGFDPHPLIRVDVLGSVAEANENNNWIEADLAAPTPAAECLETPTAEVVTQGPVLTLSGHQGKVWSVAFSPDGSLLASGSVDNTLRLWDIDDGRLLRTMQGHRFPITAIGFTSNSASLVTGSSDGILRLWQVTNGRLLQSLAQHSGWITSMDLSDDGRWLASAAQDFTVRLWRLPNGSPVQTIDEGMAQVNSLDFAPDSRSLAWGEANGTVRIRSMSGPWLGLFRATAQDGVAPVTQAVTSVKFTPDGQQLAAGYADGTIRIWQIEGSSPDDLAGATPAVLAGGSLAQVLDGHRQAISGLAFSPDGKLLISAAQDGTLRLWKREESSSGTPGAFQAMPVMIFAGHEGAVNSVSFSPLGDLVASASDDGTVRLWEIPEGIVP